MLRKIPLSILLLVALAVTAQAQPYALKLERPRPAGQKFSISSWFESRQMMTVSAGETIVSHEDSTVKIFLQADAEVIKSEPLEIQFEIFQCVKFFRGDTIEIVPPGTRVMRVGNPGSSTVRAMEEELSEQVLSDLDDAIGGFNQKDADLNFGTKKPQFVGATWPVNVKRFTDDFSSSTNIKVAEKDVSGKARLVGISSMHEIPVYKVKVDLDMKNLKIPGLDAFKKQNIAALVQFQGDYPLDTAMGIKRANMHMIMDIDATGKPDPNTPELTLKGKMERSQVVEFTYNKD